VVNGIEKKEAVKVGFAKNIHTNKKWVRGRGAEGSFLERK